MTPQATLSRLLHRFTHSDDGAVAIVAALLLPMMFGIVALGEASRVYSVKNQLQITADAAAMASVRHVPEGLTPVQVKATDYAHRNMPSDGQYGDVLIAGDVEIGSWDSNTRTFTAGEPASAVRVTTRGEMPLYFASALRNFHDAFSDAPTSFEPAAQAIALLRLDKCYENGFVAGGRIDMNSSNTFNAGFCVYGRGGVTMNNSNEFAPGTGVGMLNLADLTEGGNNPGLQDALVQKDIAGLEVGRAEQLIDDLAAGFGPVPDYITRTEPPSDTLPDVLVPGTMYIYTGTNDVTRGDLEDVAIISQQASIKIKSNSVLRNVLLASRKSVDISSNVTIGNEDYCDTGEGASLIISIGAVTDKKSVSVGTNSNINLHGVQIVSEGSLEMNSNLTITGASVQATNNIVFNSRFEVAGCPGETPNVTGEGTKVAQLVN